MIVRADLQIIGTEPKPFEEVPRELHEMNCPKAILTEGQRILRAVSNKREEETEQKWSATY